MGSTWLRQRTWPLCGASSYAGSLPGAEPGLDVCGTRAVFPGVASRARTIAKLQYEPRVDILQRLEYVPLHTACWPDWLPAETLFLPQNVEPSSLPGAELARIPVASLYRCHSVPPWSLLFRRTGWASPTVRARPHLTHRPQHSRQAPQLPSVFLLASRYAKLDLAGISL